MKSRTMLNHMGLMPVEKPAVTFLFGARLTL